MSTDVMGMVKDPVIFEKALDTLNNLSSLVDSGTFDN